jgi:hypothetical protein
MNYFHKAPYARSFSTTALHCQGQLDQWDSFSWEHHTLKGKVQKESLGILITGGPGLEIQVSCC